MPLSVRLSGALQRKCAHGYHTAWEAPGRLTQLLKVKVPKMAVRKGEPHLSGQPFIEGVPLPARLRLAPPQRVKQSVAHDFSLAHTAVGQKAQAGLRRPRRRPASRGPPCPAGRLRGKQFYSFSMRSFTRASIRAASIRLRLFPSLIPLQRQVD